MNYYTTAQAAAVLGAAESTVTKHARILGIKRVGRDYWFSDGQIEELRRSMAGSKRGRPTKR